MAKPDNVSRFFYYLGVLRSGGALHHSLIAAGLRLADRDLAPVKKRQFLDDMAYLRELLPVAEPGAILDSQGGRHTLVRVQGDHKLSESEFLPFLGALSRTTNLFPYPVDGWLVPLTRTYSNPALQALEGRILYTSTPHPDRLKTEHFHSLVQSLVARTRVDLTYRNREGIDRKLDFEPLAFLNHNGVWYLVGDGIWSHRTGDSDQPTQLKLSRLRLCHGSERPFRNRFDLATTTGRLRSTYGSHLILEQGAGPRTVVFRFFGDAVGFVKESYFHAGQTVTDNADGSCDLTLRVNDLFDALQLAGQWGALVRPLAPPDLVDRWRSRARDVAVWASDPGTDGH
jgi:hypothetical protein